MRLRCTSRKLPTCRKYCTHCSSCAPSNRPLRSSILPWYSRAGVCGAGVSWRRSSLLSPGPLGRGACATLTHLPLTRTPSVQALVATRVFRGRTLSHPPVTSAPPHVLSELVRRQLAGPEPPIALVLSVTPQRSHILTNLNAHLLRALMTCTPFAIPSRSLLSYSAYWP